MHNTRQIPIGIVDVSENGGRNGFFGQGGEFGGQGGKERGSKMAREDALQGMIGGEGIVQRWRGL